VVETETPPPVPTLQDNDPHDPHGGNVGSMEAPKLQSRTAPGKFDIRIDGDRKPLAHLPYVSNAATWVPRGQFGRLSLAAAETDRSEPILSIVLLGPRLDELKFPKTFEAEPAPGEMKGPSLRVTWRVHDKRIYKSFFEDDLGDAKLTVTSFADGKVRGEIEATVKLANPDLGPPLKVDGTFEVDVRLAGIEPNPTPGGKPKDRRAAAAARAKAKAKTDDAKASTP
jgi:hypothetical protein